ncbi:YggS family pyridoxal phosphate-dependent enzyme [Peribacillus saganii]|uniref:Pyridoxal phosphate homeostasis protein n=1 Tax=Peribacillus saganii TaxID=2303992 RepID=A0A372LC08_9BACI|nr:YggS family pyridoxal phosphate-dependent enzyme [Peribacillus saganii]RFU63193.1 YggS family pyridoxal phosphate-dependent enzyme [Peribacillus saganii]
MKVADNLNNIKNKIEEACEMCGRTPEEIKIVAVTKYVSTERAAEALEAGITDFGENRDEGLLAKYEHLGDKPVWHFIGTLQTRKVKNIIGIADYIHSLDRVSLAEEIQKRAHTPVKCFVQVNASGEESKHGISPDEALYFIKELSGFDNIIIEGLMTMAPLTEEEGIIRSAFRKLKKLQQEIQAAGLKNAPCRELSMGMSNDFMIAIEEGATFIRIGTALVGEDS